MLPGPAIVSDIPQTLDEICVILEVVNLLLGGEIMEQTYRSSHLRSPWPRRGQWLTSLAWRRHRQATQQHPDCETSPEGKPSTRWCSMAGVYQPGALSRPQVFQHKPTSRLMAPRVALNSSMMRPRSCLDTLSDYGVTALYRRIGRTAATRLDGPRPLPTSIAPAFTSTAVIT